MDKENIELAEEHIKLAEDLVLKEARDGDKKTQEELKDVEFSLEKAEAGLEDLEKSEKDK